MDESVYSSTFSTPLNTVDRNRVIERGFIRLPLKYW